MNKIPPYNTVRENFEENYQIYPALLNEELIFHIIGIPADEKENFRKGVHKIDEQIAETLTKHIGSSPRFWLKLQENFDKK